MPLRPALHSVEDHPPWRSTHMKLGCPMKAGQLVVVAVRLVASLAESTVPCSHFYGWKITQEFEHKFLGV